MNAPMRVRALTVIVLFAIGFTTVSARLIYLQVLCHDKFAAEAMRAQYRVVPQPAMRGRILDCQDRIFAQSLQVTDLYIDGKLASEDPSKLNAVASILHMDPKELQQMVSPDNRYRFVQEEIDPMTKDQLVRLNYRPLIYTERVRRFYPNGREASHVIGFTNEVRQKEEDWDRAIFTEKGVAGIEQVMNKYLAGVVGEQRIVRDRSGREIPAYRRASSDPQNGYDVVLTIDQVIQHAVEEEADRLVEKYTPETLSIIVTRPSTGEVLAMTSRPTFDPGDRKTMLDVANLRNCAISDIYEPGSVFKIVTCSAALSEGIATLDTPIYCENGTFYYAGTTLRDTHENGTLTVRRALEVSSNIAFAKLGLALGQEKLYQQVRQLGFGQLEQDPALALPGEQRGLLRPTGKWSKISLTRIPIGYEIGVTNLQMTMAMGAVANGGKLMRPMLVRDIIDANGKVVKSFAPEEVRQVIPPEVTADMRSALAGVVSDEGTAQGAKVQGYTAAGKTGTAKKWNIKLRTYENGAYYSSFIGFVPADQPQFLISIIVNQPHGQVYGGKVAGPAFSNIATKVAQQLNMIAGDQPRIMANIKEERPQ